MAGAESHPPQSQVDQSGATPTGQIDPWLAQAIVREAAEAMVVADPEGIIRLWNRAAEGMFGYSATEAVGRSLDVIIPVKLRERHWIGYQQTMATGRTRYAEELLNVPAVHKDGRRLSIEFSVALLTDGPGRVTGIAAIMREVTERRATEQALRARLAELEQRLACGQDPSG